MLLGVAGMLATMPLLVIALAQAVARLLLVSALVWLLARCNRRVALPLARGF